MRHFKSHHDVVYHALVMSGYDTVSLRDRSFTVAEAVDNPEFFNSISYLVNAYSALVVHGSTFLTKLYKPSAYSGVVDDIELHPTEDNDLFPPLHNTVGVQLSYCLHIFSDVAPRLAARNGKTLAADIFVEILAEVADATPSGSYIEPQPIMASLMEQRIIDMPVQAQTKSKTVEHEQTEVFEVIEEEPVKTDNSAGANEFIIAKGDDDFNFLG